MGQQERGTIHLRWNRNLYSSVRIASCTSAFRTGIESRNGPLVVNFGGCCSLGEYVQEIGQAGRDGQVADFVLVYSHMYAKQIIHVLNYNESNGIKIEDVLKTASFAEFKFSAENKTNCRKNMLYAVLDGKSPGPCMFTVIFVMSDYPVVIK